MYIFSNIKYIFSPGTHQNIKNIHYQQKWRARLYFMCFNFSIDNSKKYYLPNKKMNILYIINFPIVTSIFLVRDIYIDTL